jgi:hypothetical protein
MTTTTRLTDTQTAVLTAAADAPSGRIAWFPDTVQGGARAKVLQGLVARGLVEAVDEAYRLTSAGYAAIGRTRADAEKDAPKAPDTRAPRRTRENTKQAAMLALLGRPEGATLAQLIESTGWQAHSVRGALVNLAKHLGIRIQSEKTDGVRIYRVCA